jgi:hypothetical protein
VQSLCEQDFPDCSRCRGPRSEDLRKFWGCDAKADHPVWVSGCGTCHGSDAECNECHGTNKVHQHRCPSSIIESAPTHLRIHLDLLMRSFRHYTERNVMPVVGGWLDQSRSYLAAIDLIDAERSRWDSVRTEYEEKKRASEARKARSQMPRKR